MEKMKLNIQLFGLTVTLTANETAIDDTAINNNQTYINLAIRVQTTKPTWNGQKGAYYQVTTTSQNNGEQTGSKYYFSIGSSTGNGDKTFNVTLGPFDHNADGTLNNVSISAYVRITDSTHTTKTASVAMATIPRASQPTTSASVNMGTAVTINTNRYSSSFTHTITYAFGGTSGTIGTNVGTSVSWTPPLTLANQIPNATSGVATITCITYSGGTAIGTKTTTITLNVPASVVPTISTLALQEAGDVPSGWNTYVQNKSKIKVTYTASGSYSSTISSYATTGDGYTYTGNSATTNYIRTSGNITLTGKVIDSRGRQATKSETRYVYPYANPTISTAQIQRCDVDGNIDSNGEYCLISYGASISSCNGNNPSTYKVKYRVHNIGSYNEIPLTTNVTTYTTSGMLYTDGIYPANRGSGTKLQLSSLNTYDIQFYVADYFTENTTTLQLDTGFDLMNFNANGKAMAIGKVSEAGANQELFEVGIPTDHKNTLTVTTNGIYNQLENSYGFAHYTTDGANGHWFNTDVKVQGNVYGGTGYNRQLAYKDETMPLVTLTLNNEWIMGYKASGDNFCVILPFTNPDKKSTNINITSADFYNGGWKTLTYTGRTIFQTFIKLSFSTDANVTNGYVYLTRITGTIALYD